MRHNLRYAGSILVLGSLIAAGCAVGPTFERPIVNAPASWATPGAQTHAPADLAAWWRSFQDPLLDTLMDEALESNLDVRLAAARVRQARASVGVASGSLWPQVNATGQYERQRSGTLAGSALPANLWRAGFDASWELDIFGGTRRSVEAAKADLESAEYASGGALVTLAAELAEDYAQLRGAQERLRVARDNLETQRQSLSIAQRRKEAGFATELDVANASAQVSTTESQVPPLEAQIRQLSYSIEVLLDREPGSLGDRLRTDAPQLPTPPAVPVGLPAETLARRPDVHQSEAGLHAATARVGAAIADLYPRIFLTGDLAVSAAQLSGLTTWANRAWGLGPTITWPLASGGRIRANIEVQRALVEEAALTHRQTVLQALLDVETSITAYTQDSAQLDELQSAVDENRKAVGIARQQYAAGQVEFLNVISAQTQLAQSEDQLAQAHAKQITDLVGLYKALGGGWPSAADAAG